VVATHGAAHNQEFEIECLVPKLDIQVFGAGGSRRAGEQAAAKLALEAAQAALMKSLGSGRKSRPRAAQLKLAGIATIQPESPPVTIGKKQVATARNTAKIELETQTNEMASPTASNLNGETGTAKKSCHQTHRC